MNAKHQQGSRWFKFVLWMTLIAVGMRVLVAFSSTNLIDKLMLAFVMLPTSLIIFGIPAYLLGRFLAKSSPSGSEAGATAPSTVVLQEPRRPHPPSGISPATLSLGAQPPDLDSTHAQAIVFPQPSGTRTEKLWAAALAEFEGPSRRPGLWARVFSEAQGTESLAKANYLKCRVDEMAHEENEQLEQLARVRLREDERKRLAGLTEEQRAYELLPKGTCPSCDGTLPLASESCPNCLALFGADSSWRIKPIQGI